MKAAWVVAMGVFLTPITVWAQEACTDGVCVEQEDLEKFVQLAKDAKCRETTPPTFKLDSISVVVDEKGRIYGSGSDPKPYMLTMDWCNYHVEGQGKVTILAAKRIPPEYGFRFRPKAILGYLPLSALEERDGMAGLDAGVLLEPGFFHWANLNGYVGVRSFGVGIGVDLTKNLGLYAGWAMAWGTWQHNPHAAISFALW